MRWSVSLRNFLAIFVNARDALLGCYGVSITPILLDRAAQVEHEAAR